MTEAAFPSTLLEQIADTGIIAVLVVDDAASAVPLAEALLEGGVQAMELTLRTPAALDALRNIRRDVPQMLAGIGTILTPEQVSETVAAGANFGVSPGVNRRVVKAAQEAGLPFAPGVCTPTDIEAAIELGCRALKFFPCEASGGLKYLRSAAAPFQHLGVRFVPLGGVGPTNLATYLEDDLILAVGGSWLAPRPLIADRDWVEIRNRAEQAREQVQSIRSGN